MTQTFLSKCHSSRLRQFKDNGLGVVLTSVSKHLSVYSKLRFHYVTGSRLPKCSKNLSFYDLLSRRTVCVVQLFSVASCIGFTLYIPALTSLAPHSPGLIPFRSPSGPIHRVAATGLPVAFRTCTAHSASSTCSKY